MSRFFCGCVTECTGKGKAPRGRREDRVKPALARAVRVALAVIAWIAFIGAGDAAADPGRKALDLLDKMDAAYARVNDWSAKFLKQEIVGGKLLDEEVFFCKFQKPFKVYMKALAGPNRGTEALFVKGENEGRLLVRPAGLLGFKTFALDPRGAMAMRGNRHPVTEVGFGFLLEEFRRNIEPAVAAGELEVKLSENSLAGRPATVIEGRFTPRGGRKYYCARFTVYVDRELLLPVGNFFYDERDRLFEKYIFTDVKLNVGFTKLDFSTRNKDYRF